MTAAEVSRWIQEMPLCTAVRESALVYPVILSSHLSSIALFGGAILMTDLRLLGVAMTGRPAAEVIAQLRFWKRIGFCVMVTCGLLLAGAKAESYYANPYFQTKLALLGLVGVHAMVFRRSVYRNESVEGRSAKAAAWVSLVLWVGILSMGRLIAYWE